MNKNQRGMTIWSWLFVLGTIGFIALVTMKLLPVYMENMSVKKAVKQVAADPGAGNLKLKDIYTRMTKQFYIDEVHTVKEEDITLDIADDGTKTIVITYEVRKPILANVDAVVWFEEKAVIGETE